jgi:hypothetical protein
MLDISDMSLPHQGIGHNSEAVFRGGVASASSFELNTATVNIATRSDMIEIRGSSATASFDAT